MAADQERADRIRALKQERPDLTWRRIGDYVGVSERAATDWQKKGGIEYDNAKKLAELFEVDVDYIWRGPSEAERAPSPFAGQDALADRLDAIENAIAELRRERDKHAERVEALLARQDEVLERIENAIAREEQVKESVDERIARHAREIASPDRPEADAPDPKRAPRRRPAAKKSRAAKPQLR